MRRLKITLAILLIGTLLPSLQLVWWHRQASETFQKHDQELARIPDPQGLSVRRIPLYEPALKGDSWESFQPLLAPLMDLKYSWSQPFPTDQEHAQLAALFRPTFDGLRSAYSKEHLTLPKTLEERINAKASFSRGLMTASWILFHLSLASRERHRHEEALDLLILNLAVCSDLRQIPGYGKTPADWSLAEEQRALGSWRGYLKEFSLSPKTAASISGQLDRLLSARSSIHDSIAAQGIYLRRGILELEQDGHSGHPYGETPSWRHAYSARLGRAKTLNQIEGDWKRLESLREIPSHQWSDALKTISDHAGSEAVAHLDSVRSTYAQEVDCLRWWTSIRIAMALARFEIEQRRAPASLAELVPAYLQALPSCPQGGEPFSYLSGEFSCAHTGKWKVSLHQ